MNLNLLVIRTNDIEKLKSQYELLGFTFDYHRHGNGPYHYAAEHSGFVFEIYPLTKSMTKADNSLRLGFGIENLKDSIKILKQGGWEIISEPTKTEWGIISVVQDLDGRKVELKNITR
ncbi:VOC family protein [Tenacibaculum sp. M341]|uniref:VOC family protein n=1 Tax=Tenacibaculum sp. M341 TaxID=2530339 RepID=UPI001047D6A1|nr:VOC family protein [Tenacibaculum sp. M341]TCI85085.1 glyoxalase/bleomycin resistance/extradiol dioxygenase family protein [Tenacibaculum sp. M341]